MKFHWGHGILSFIILFFILNAVFLVWISRQDNTLVEENYYAKELKYQEVIDKRGNAEGLVEKVIFDQNASGIWLHFPLIVKTGKLSGNIMLYRPSDASLDMNVPLALDTARNQLIPAKNLSKGKYVIKLGWALDDKAYYQETEILIH